MTTLAPNEDGERGAIVNTGSVAAEDGQIGQVAYSAAKAGIKGMTLTIARDLSSESIRINTILPGIMATPAMLGVKTCAPAIFEGLSASIPATSGMRGAAAPVTSIVLKRLDALRPGGASRRKT